MLARDVAALCDSPDFDKSMMDGFAFRWSDLFLGRVRAGAQGPVFAGGRPGRLKTGAAVRIATGAAVPAGADTVVKIEDVRLKEDGRLEISKKIRRAENVLGRGRHVRKGDKLLSRGDLLTAGRLALLASQGFKRVPVFARPSMAILTTGDEVARPARQKTRFQIWDASGPMLDAGLRSLGIRPVRLGLAADNEKELFKKIRQGLTYDIFLITGAVSAGERDFIPRLLRKAGVRVYFHGVRMKPGKPLFFGGRGRALVFGLPGNPVSTWVTFLLFVKPALERFCGLRPGPVWQEGVLSKPCRNASGRLSFAPARLVSGVLEPLRFHDSADVKGAADAQAFFALEENQTAVPGGTPVKFIQVDL